MTLLFTLQMKIFKRPKHWNSSLSTNKYNPITNKLLHNWQVYEKHILTCHQKNANQLLNKSLHWKADSSIYNKNSSNYPYRFERQNKKSNISHPIIII